MIDRSLEAAFKASSDAGASLRSTKVVPGQNPAVSFAGTIIQSDVLPLRLQNPKVRANIAVQTSEDAGNLRMNRTCPSGSIR